MCVVNGSWDLHVLYSNRKVNEQRRDVGAWWCVSDPGPCWAFSPPGARPGRAPFPVPMEGPGESEIHSHSCRGRRSA